ncbi:MAG: 4-diphosphocytidyl-2-C-methyl-D-erythritol kinase [Bacteroidota bacterium]|jgi:4-diphosphocytidyl-2-C-methyl-D-erythritol kinase
MIAFPNAKINLGLHIVAKRPDGFHNIETIFYPIPINDALEFVPSHQTSLHTTGIEIDAPMEQNLVYKAYKLLEIAFKLPPVSIHLHKSIPSGAGLGGGSADAAFMLRMLNEYFELKQSNIQLQEFARKLGSDCAFFIDNIPTFAYGKGDQFSPLSLNLRDYYLVLVKPPIHVSTAQAYAGVKPQTSATSLSEQIRQSPETWRGKLINDFEGGIFVQYPEIQAIKTQLYDMGATYAAMSGSGSSVFGLFAQAPILPASLFVKDHFVWAGSLNL